MRRLQLIIRLKDEFRELNQNPNRNLPIFVGLVSEDDIFNWKVTVVAPKNTLYKGGVFIILIHFPDEYPNIKPEVRFKTPVYHLNVNSKRNYNDAQLGIISLSVFCFWKPEYKIEDILVSIYSLFYMVNPDYNFQLGITEEYRRERALYEQKAKYFTGKYANPYSFDREYNEDWDFSYNQ